MSLEQMFEKILNKLSNFEKRFENIDTKLDNFQMGLEQVEKFFNAEIAKINKTTTTKVSLDELFLLNFNWVLRIWYQTKDLLNKPRKVPRIWERGLNSKALLK